MAFDKMVVYSRLLPDMTTTHTFMDLKLLYINGVVAANPSGLMFPNDLIQVVVSV
jgi:hypothetical protein